MSINGNEENDLLIISDAPKLTAKYKLTEGEVKGGIIFVHGVCHGAWCFKNFLNFFSKNGYDCFALNLRGHGENGMKDLAGATLSDYVKDVKDCVDYCKSNYKERIGDKLFILGHSMGGAVVQKYIGQYENTVQGAILFAPATAGGMNKCKTGLDTYFLNKKLNIAAKKASGKKVTADELYLSAFFNSRVDMNDIREYNKLLQKESKTIIMEDLYKDYSDNHNELSIPVMVIGSEKDIYFPKKSLIKTVSYYRHVRYELLKDLCHDMMLDPDWIKSAEPVLQFVDNIVRIHT